MKAGITYSHLDDLELLKLLKEDDKESFTEIYSRYHKEIYNYSFSIVKQEEQSEDLVHEVFMKLWESRKSFMVHGSFKSYLFRICHNKAMDVLQKMIKDRKLRNDILETFENWNTAIHHSQEELIRYDNLIETSLDALSPQRRKVYELCRLNGKTYKEAAIEMGIAPSTVKEHMAKALSILRHSVKNRSELTLLLFILGNIF